MCFQCRDEELARRRVAEFAGLEEESAPVTQKPDDGCVLSCPRAAGAARASLVRERPRQCAHAGV